MRLAICIGRLQASFCFYILSTTYNILSLHSIHYNIEHKMKNVSPAITTEPTLIKPQQKQSYYP